MGNGALSKSDLPKVQPASKISIIQTYKSTQDDYSTLEDENLRMAPSAPSVFADLPPRLAVCLKKDPVTLASQSIRFIVQHELKQLSKHFTMDDSGSLKLPESTGNQEAEKMLSASLSLNRNTSSPIASPQNKQSFQKRFRKGLLKFSAEQRVDCSLDKHNTWVPAFVNGIVTEHKYKVIFDDGQAGEFMGRQLRSRKLDEDGALTASSHGFEVAIHKWVYEGGSAELQDGDGATMLHRACENGHVGLVRFLLEEENVDQTVVLPQGSLFHGATAFDMAFAKGHLALIKFIVLYQGRGASSPVGSEKRRVTRASFRSEDSRSVSRSHTFLDNNRMRSTSEDSTGGKLTAQHWALLDGNSRRSSSISTLESVASPKSVCSDAQWRGSPRLDSFIGGFGRNAVVNSFVTSLQNHIPELDFAGLKLMKVEDFMKAGSFVSFDTCEQNKLHVAVEEVLPVLRQGGAILYICNQWDGAGQIDPDRGQYALACTFLSQYSQHGFAFIWNRFSCLNTKEMSRQQLPIIFLMCSSCLILPRLVSFKPYPGCHVPAGSTLTNLKSFYKCPHSKFEVLMGLSCGLSIYVAYAFADKIQCFQKVTGSQLFEDDENQLQGTAIYNGFHLGGVKSMPSNMLARRRNKLWQLILRSYWEILLEKDPLKDFRDLAMLIIHITQHPSLTSRLFKLMITVAEINALQVVGEDLLLIDLQNIFISKKTEDSAFPENVRILLLTLAYCMGKLPEDIEDSVN